MITTPATLARRNLAAALMAAGIFALLSALCAVYSKGFLEEDAMTHFLFARSALHVHHYLFNVWGRPLVTMLYTLPAQYGPVGVRLLSLGLALICGGVTYRLAREQGMTNPALAVICLFAQPLFFFHSFSELTEMPFATVLVLAFWAYQRRKFAAMAALAALLPLTRPEGFGFVLLAAAALVLHGRKRWLFILIIPLAAWSYGGWVVSGKPPFHWWMWLPRNWPYSTTSPYGRGYLLWFVATLPILLSPLFFPALVFGIRRMWKEGWDSSSVSLPIRRASSPATQIQQKHLGNCKLLIVCIPLSVLAIHSFLWWRGLQSSSGEFRYLLIAAPMWAILCASGWEWYFARFKLPSPILWAGLAALLPLAINKVYRVFPLNQTNQDHIGQNVAEWYCHNPRLQTDYPNIMSSLPSVSYYMNMSKDDAMSSMNWGRYNVTHPTDGTFLIWEKGGNFNSDINLCVPLEMLQNPANGWVFCRKMEWGDSYCLIFKSRCDARGRLTPLPAGPATRPASGGAK